jgi:hypothetical protein
MELVNAVYPMRSIIRCKAKQQLLIEATQHPELMPLDEMLFSEVAKTLFRLNQYQVIYQLCRSKQAAAEIEDEIAAELAITYQQIVFQQHDPIVQQLNALL